MNESHRNAARFGGFAQMYDSTRPACPAYVTEILLRYLSRRPQTVVNLGCGTGLSTLIWADKAGCVIGVEPSEDMLRLAKTRALAENIRYVHAFSDNTGLDAGSADIITCSQSFHWMEPVSTLQEIDRLLKPDGVFAAYDCDWPPVCGTEVELAYINLFAKVRSIEAERPEYRNAFVRYPKECHLANIQRSGYFAHVREIVLSHAENCDAKRLVNIALSQGGLQAIVKREPQLVEQQLRDFRQAVTHSFGSETEMIDFCYRMRLGVKSARL